MVSGSSRLRGTPARCGPLADVGSGPPAFRPAESRSGRQGVKRLAPANRDWGRARPGMKTSPLRAANRHPLSPRVRPKGLTLAGPRVRQSAISSRKCLGRVKWVPWGWLDFPEVKRLGCESGHRVGEGLVVQLRVMASTSAYHLGKDVPRAREELLGHQAVATSAVSERGSSERAPGVQAVRQMPQPQHFLRSTMTPF